MSARRGAYPPDPYANHAGSQQDQGEYYTTVQQDPRQRQQYAIASRSPYPQAPVSGTSAGYGSQTTDPEYDVSRGQYAATAYQAVPDHPPTVSAPQADAGSYEDDPQYGNHLDSPRVAFPPGHEQEDPVARTTRFVQDGRTNRTGTRYSSYGPDPGESGRQGAIHMIQAFDNRFSPTSDPRTQAAQQAYWPAHAQDDDSAYAHGYPTNIQDFDPAYVQGYGAAYSQDDHQAYYQGQDHDSANTPAYDPAYSQGYPANAQVHNDPRYSRHGHHRRSGGRSSRSRR